VNKRSVSNIEIDVVRKKADDLNLSREALRQLIFETLPEAIFDAFQKAQEDGVVLMRSIKIRGTIEVGDE
jgi:hypothetical protein